MTQIKQLDELKDFAKYKTDLGKSLARVGKIPAQVIYVRKFQFNTKAAPMTLVGPVDGKLKAALVEQKTPMKLGKCVRRDDGKIVLYKLNAIEVNAAFEAASVKEQIDANAEFADVSVQAKLEQHLDETGRATGDQAKRDEASGRILAGMEKATNERNKAIDPSKPESHHVSAHGPGTDQVTRLVGGRRPDEVKDEMAKAKAQGKTPVKTVKLTGNAHGVPDQEVPVYEKTGQNPSNRSGAFSSNTAMLHAIEEAYAQAAQLDGYLDSVMKQAFKTNNEDVMKKKPVAEAYVKVTTARRFTQAVTAELKKPGLKPEQVQQLQKQLATFEKKAEDAISQFQQVFKANGGDQIVRPEDMNVGSSRLVRTVDPGSGEGFLPEGLGTGLEATGASKQKKGEKIASGGKTVEEVMQERFKTIQPVGNQKTARVVMDPAYVKNPDGSLSRAGWDVQTAFPQEGVGQDSFAKEGTAKKFVDTNKAIKTVETKLKLVNDAHAKLALALKNADSTLKKANDSIGFKQNMLPKLKQEVEAAKDDEKTKATQKLQKMQEEITALQKKLPPLEQTAQETREKFEKIDTEKTKLDLELKTLNESVGDSDA